MKFDTQRCMGEKKIGAFQMGGISGWQRCENKPIAILTIKDGNGSFKTTVCKSCWDDGIRVAGDSIIDSELITDNS